MAFEQGGALPVPSRLRQCLLAVHFGLHRSRPRLSDSCQRQTRTRGPIHIFVQDFSIAVCRPTVPSIGGSDSSRPDRTAPSEAALRCPRTIFRHRPSVPHSRRCRPWRCALRPGLERISRLGPPWAHNCSVTVPKNGCCRWAENFTLVRLRRTERGRRRAYRQGVDGLPVHCCPGNP